MADTRWSFRSGLIGALALAAVVSLVAWLIGGGSGVAKQGTSRISDAVDLQGPSGLRPGEARSVNDGGILENPVALEQGASVEVADPETGRLAQRYRADRIDPLPDHWMKMRKPVATIFPPSGKIVALESDSGLVRVPHRALESGTMTGNVVIRLFDRIGDRMPDPKTTTPAVRIDADEAEFDQTLGEIRCDQKVRVTTPNASFAGIGLTLLLDAQGRAPERLVIERATEPIHLRMESRVSSLESRESRPDTRSSRPDTRDSKPETRDSTPETQDSTPGTRDPKPESRDASLETRDSRLETQPRFYRLTLHDNVHIERTDNGHVSTIDASTLAIIFSLEGNSLGSALALGIGAGTPTVSMSTSVAGSAPVQLVAAVLGWGSDGAGSSTPPEVQVTYTGRLVMVPAAPEDSLDLPDDVRVFIDGAPVRLSDSETGGTAQCGQVRYDFRDDRVQLSSTPAHPLRIDVSGATLTGDSLWVGRARGTGRIEGAGRMTVQRHGRSDASMHGAPIALASAGGDSALAELLIAAAMAGTDDPMSGTSLDITWKDGVDLDFEPAAPGKESGRLKAATFVGAVKVDGDDFDLRSDRLKVGFAGGAAAKDAIDLIEATGAVHVDRVGAAGTMDAESLSIRLAQVDGKSTPTELVASGSVAAADDRQTIWADALTAEFMPRASAAPAAPPPPGSAQAAYGSVEIRTVRAHNGVSILLADGARVYADELNGDNLQGTLDLTGQDMLIVRDRVVVDGLRSVHFDRAAGSAHSDGPGRFRYFTAPIPIPAEGRAPRPTVATGHAMETTWTSAMHYDDKANDGFGSLDLRGSVHALSTPDSDAADELNCDALTLDFMKRRAAVATPASDAGAGSGKGAATELKQSNRDLAHFIARGAARLESRKWLDGDRNKLPRLFRILGDHVEYDLRNREADVIGNGSLLVHDPRAEERAAGAGAMFGRRGTTMFSWKTSMQMRRQLDDRYLITMRDDVEVLHKEDRDDSAFAMTGDRLEVTVVRPQDTPAPLTPQDGAELGTTGEVTRVHGLGRVLIKTDEQDVSCHEFDYDVPTQLALLEGHDGFDVTVQMKGQPAPVRARHVRWDFQNGRITVMGAGGGVAR